LFIQWVALSSVACLCVARRFLNGLGDFWAATWSYLLTLLITLAVSELAWWLVNWMPGSVALTSHSHAQHLFRCFGIGAIVSALALRYFYVQHQWRRRVEMEAEARFQALQSRIRPHFLFNCMNTIASLTRREPRLAEESVEDLADLFRASLQDIDQASTLAEEIDLCRRYLRIEKHRLGDRLDLQWALDDLPATARIPSLIIQPLLENAIYHGIEPAAGGGSIEIAGEKSGGVYALTVTNPLPRAAPPGSPHEGNRLALDNIRQRLSAWFGSAARLQAHTDDGSYRVTVELPLEDEHTDR